MTGQAYDLLVIGAGAAGSTAASTVAKDGTRVGLVERDKLGGTCLNYGCDPTKTLLRERFSADTFLLQEPTICLPQL